MHNITIIIRAKMINITANGIVHEPNFVHTIEVASENTAKKSKRIAANTYEMIGIHLGKQ